MDHAGADPYAQQIANAAKGRPGGRLLIRATAPEVPTLPQLIRAAIGLDLAVTITLTDHSPDRGDLRHVQGESWDIMVSPAALPAAPADPPVHRTGEAAIENCLEFLETATIAAIPADPNQPVNLPP